MDVTRCCYLGRLLHLVDEGALIPDGQFERSQ
jgi:hypothetical protein